jgi:hypothetical protein
MRGDDTYPPELMETMRLAFHKTCKALQLSDVDDAFTDIVATSREVSPNFGDGRDQAAAA